jgi:hypothetical protein
MRVNSNGGNFNGGGMATQGAEEGDTCNPESVDPPFLKAKSELAKAMKNPKARKKIPPDTQSNIERNHKDCKGSMTKAQQEEQNAKQMVQNDPMAAQIVGEMGGANKMMNGGGGDRTQNLISNISSNFGALQGKHPAAGALGGGRDLFGKNGMDSLGLGGLARGNRGGAGAFNPGGAEDIGSLMGKMQGAKGEAGGIRGDIQGFTGQQDKFLGMGNQTQQRVEGLGAAKDMFGAKEQSHAAQQQAFGDAGKGLKNAAQGLNSAAKVLQGVAGMLKSAAAAVAAIPYVGPALSAALKKAATVVQMVGKMLGMAGKMCQQSGQKMDQKAAQQGALKEDNNIKKQMTEAKQLQAKDQVNRIQDKLDQVSDAKNDSMRQLEQNQEQQKAIAEKAGEMGMPMSAETPGSATNGDERPQIEKNERSGRNNMPRSGAPASGAPSAAPAAAPAAVPVAGKGAPAAGAPGLAQQAGVPQTAAPQAVGQPQAGGQNQAQGKGKDQVQPAGQANKVNPMMAGKNPFGQKKRENEGLQGDDALGGREQRGAGGGKRDRYEDELKRLSEDILSKKKDGGEGGSNSFGDRDKKRQLAMVYNQAAQENIAVKEDVEQSASKALANSAERPSRKLRTLKGDEEVGGSEAEGEGKQGRDRDREERMGRLAMNGIGAQRLLGLGGLQGLPGMGGGMAPAGLGPAQMVQPIQSMAS